MFLDHSNIFAGPFNFELTKSDCTVFSPPPPTSHQLKTFWYTTVHVCYNLYDDNIILIIATACDCSI